MNAPRCEEKECKCGGELMELNGLRFVCSGQFTLETHVDDFPIYADAPKLLERAADKLQAYREELDGDYNDPLAMEIYKALGVE